jgi:N-succinyldiaminopimelate aminotransferase
MLSNFEPYPFEKLKKLFAGITPNYLYSPIAFTIGEPQFETPAFIQEELKVKTALLNKYPKTAGEDALNEAMLGFVMRNFNITLKSGELIPTLGTREVLFNFPQFLLHGVLSPVIVYPNPFYQIYEGAAKAVNARSILLNLHAENDFLPDIEELRTHLKNGVKVSLVILNSPNNPTASVMDMDMLKEWVKLALEYDFVLLNDECYNQIYFNQRPPSLLEASVEVGNEHFKNILIVNSISKRSSAPGLRSGFIAGDELILQKYMQYRTYIGTANGLPMQYAAAKAWADEAHVESARAAYTKNFELARKILGVTPAKASFYIWLNVGDGETFAKKAYEQRYVSILPGAYLARGFASEYVRIALVENEEKTEDGLTRLKELM